MKVLFVINPCSGRGKIKSELFDVLKIFCSAGYEVTTHITSKQGNATEVCKTAQERGFERVICCGGDGTLNEVITGLLQSDSNIPISYIPAGTTNDFAKTLNIDTNIKNAAKKIVKSEETVEIDIGKFLPKKYFTYIASFGLLTSVSYKTQQNVKNTFGHMAYVFEGIASLANIETYNISVKADDKEFEGEYIYGGITNSTSVAGIFKYNNNQVSLNDGVFEILMIKNPKKPNDFRKILTGLTNSNFNDASVFDFCYASKITLQMPAGMVWTLDGESANGKKKIEIENIPRRIKIIK